MEMEMEKDLLRIKELIQELIKIYSIQSLYVEIDEKKEVKLQIEV